MSALNFIKRMLEACVSSTIRVALGKHLKNTDWTNCERLMEYF